jgi:hypothetical protein
MRQRKASQEGLFDYCRAIAELATPGPPSEKAVGTTGMPFRGSARSHPRSTAIKVVFRQNASISLQKNMFSIQPAIFDFRQIVSWICSCSARL